MTKQGFIRHNRHNRFNDLFNYRHNQHNRHIILADKYCKGDDSYDTK
jgi:hypothetical protein